MEYRAGLFLPAIPIALAQPALSRGAYAGLHGQVTAPSGAALCGAIVNAAPETGGKSHFTTTGAKGTYLFSVLTPGTYSVTVKMPGYRLQRISNVKLAADLNRSLDVTMSRLAAEVMESPGSAHPREDRWRQGEAAGRQNGAAQLLLRQLRRLHGPLAPAIEERVRSAGTGQILEWGERLVTSESLDQVFRPAGE